MKKFSCEYVDDGITKEYWCMAKNLKEAKIQFDDYIHYANPKPWAYNVVKPMSEVKTYNWAKLAFLASAIGNGILVIENFINLVFK